MNMTEPIKVLVADDHPMFKDALGRAISSHPQLELVGEAEDGEQALEKIRRTSPDVAVLDVKMPGIDGVGVIEAITLEQLSTKVMLLSGYVEPDVVYHAIESGARAYFSKLTDATVICDAIVAVHGGETILPAEVQTSIAEQIRARGSAERPALTPREHEILRLTAGGRSGPEIAQELSLSPGTVKTHLRHIYEKFGVSDRAAAVAEAIRRGVLDSSHPST